jgi:hypothetical protein
MVGGRRSLSLAVFPKPGLSIGCGMCGKDQSGNRSLCFSCAPRLILLFLRTGTNLSRSSLDMPPKRVRLDSERIGRPRDWVAQRPQAEAVPFQCWELPLP